MKEQIYEYLTKIPHGKVVTYKQIAEYLGNPKLARVVGNILHDNKYPDKYPCFKVVNAKGNLACHYAYGGIEGQRKRLEKEGIIVRNNKVDLDVYKWEV